jgi:hypothetical protein
MLQTVGPLLMLARRYFGIVFRFALVTAVVAAMYDAADRYNRALDLEFRERSSTERLTRGLQCGARFTNEQLRATSNAFGNFDLSKLGCSPDEFLANQAEIDRARAGDYQLMQLQPINRFAPSYTAGVALAAFVLVVLAGSFLWLGKNVLRWIWGKP